MITAISATSVTTKQYIDAGVSWGTVSAFFSASGVTRRGVVVVVPLLNRNEMRRGRKKNGDTPSPFLNVTVGGVCVCTYLSLTDECPNTEDFQDMFPLLTETTRDFIIGHQPHGFLVRVTHNFPDGASVLYIVLYSLHPPPPLQLPLPVDQRT